MKKLTEQFGLYLTAGLAKKVRDKLKKEERSFSELIRAFLRAWVDGKLEV